jgi:DNA replication and repair protein RecF
LYIDQLRMRYFRNYDNLSIRFTNGFNILYGNNAQGKTNIIEAIFMCASGRSHRTSKDPELVKIGEKGYHIHLEVSRDTGLTEIGISYSPEEKKKIKINGASVQKMGNLMGNMNAVIFSPEDLLIVKEGPSERRRFIDITLSQLKPSYFYDLQQYNKILQQRNTLLKSIQDNKSLLETLEIWNQNLAQTGARIMKTRNDFIQRLKGIAKTKHSEISDGEEELEVRYSPSVLNSSLQGIDTQGIAAAFLKELDKVQRREILKGSTLIGPQRDDYELYINGLELKLYGSQGQQRTAVLSVKLSEIDIMREDTGEYPVLLLDDVMSELDSKRQEHLVNSLEKVQTFITCTDKECFHSMGVKNKFYYYIKSGEIVKDRAESVESLE